MATLNEITYSVLSPVRPYMTGDSHLTIEKVQYDIKNLRSRLIRNEQNKNRTIDSALIQTLGCVPVKAVDASECCTVKTNCYVMRTVDKIPNAIELHRKKLITRVGPVNITSKPYSFITYTESQWAGNNTFTKNDIYAFLLNGYIYLKSNNPDIYALKYINIQGVFDDPTALADYACNEEGTVKCYDEDQPYPINDWMVSYIEDMLQEKYLKQYSYPADKANDATDQKTDP